MPDEVKPSPAREGQTYEYAVLYGDVMDQQLQLDELRTEFQELRSYVTASTTTVLTPARNLSGFGGALPFATPESSFSHTSRPARSVRVSTAKEEDASNADRAPAAVPLHALLKFAAAFMAVTALASLAMWLAGYPPIVNPFISILTAVSSPFVFAMGAAAKRV